MDQYSREDSFRLRVILGECIGGPVTFWCSFACWLVQFWRVENSSNHSDSSPLSVDRQERSVPCHRIHCVLPVNNVVVLECFTDS